MIQVSPQIKLKPITRAGRIYTPIRVALTGLRSIVEARSEDGHVIWKDFPARHSLDGPCVYDPTTRQIDGLPGLEWWSEPMQILFETPRVTDTKIKIHRRRECKSWIILNTLDTIFGHNFEFLLNVGFYLRQFPEHGLIVVALPALMRFIPEEVAEIWEVKIPMRDAEKWHEPLDELFQRRCQLGPVYIASGTSHPEPSRYNLRQHGIHPATGPVNIDAPRIVFIYRGSRLWGGSWKSERNRLARLGEWLHRLWSQSHLEIYGHANLPSEVPGWTNRTHRSEPDYDQQLMEALAACDLALGAHGSSMLLPSGICRLLLELVPLDKQPSLLQDFVFDHGAHNVRQEINRHRFLYGNSTMNDISPRRVAQLINAMISMQAHFDFYMSAQGSDPLRDVTEMEKDYAAQIIPCVVGWKKRLLQTLDLPLPARFWQYLRRLASEHD